MLMEGTHPTGCSAGGGIVIDKRLLIYGQEGKQVCLLPLLPKKWYVQTNHFRQSHNSWRLPHPRLQFESKTHFFLQKVILDHRANHPLLRIKGGGAVLRGFKIDMIGFRCVYGVCVCVPMA